MEIVKTNQSTTNNSSSNVKKDVAGNIYWKYDKTTKTGKLILKKENEEYEVQKLTIKLINLYIFIKDGGKLISLSLFGKEDNSDDYYFISIPNYFFIDIYNYNASMIDIENDKGRLRLNYQDSFDKQKITDDDKKYFNILNYLANHDNSNLKFNISIFIK